MSVQQSIYAASRDQHNNTTIMSCATEEERARFGDFTRRHLPLPSRGRKQRIADTVDEVAAGKSGLVNIEDLGRMDGTFSLRRTSPMNFKRAKLVPNMFMGPFCAKINRLSVQEREELEKPYIANLLETVRRHKLLRKENTDETMDSTTVRHAQLQAEAPTEKRKREHKPKSIDQDSTTVRHAQLQAEAPTEKRKREHKPKSIDQATTTVLHAQLQVEAPKEKRKRGRRPKSVNQVNEYYVKAGVPYAELQVEAPKERRKRGRGPKSVNQMNEYYVKAGVPYAELQVEAPKEKRKRGRRPKSVNQMNEYYVKTSVPYAELQAEAPKEGLANQDREKKYVSALLQAVQKE